MTRETLRFVAIASLVALAVATLAASPVVAQDDAHPLPGDGTADDPYVIADATDLQAMQADLDAHYVLASDVDASATAEWNQSRGFDPVGSPEEPFNGSLDGNGQTISGLVVDRSEPASVGLFGALGSDARVERLALEDVHLDSDLGKFYPTGGGIAGRSEGAVDRVAVTGETGTVGPSGGIVGVNNGTITNSYGRLSFGVNGTSGAIAGRNNGRIERAYAVAPTYNCGYPDCDYLGIAVGVDDGETRTVYEHGYETETTSRHEGLSREAATGTDAIESMTSLDFGDTWRATAGFPVLAWQYDGPDLAGVGRADQPFRVASVDDLDEVRRNRSAHYALVDDVDAGVTAGWNESDGRSGFEPIGTNGRPFSGTFDGQGHAISGLTIDRPGAPHVGLFGVVEDGLVTNLSLRDADVTGDAAVGTLVGTNLGTVEAVRADGSAAGSAVVGGLVGRSSGTERRSTAAVSVSGTERVGGLLGTDDAGTTAAVFATGAVDGDDAASTGGLVGEQLGGDVEAGYWDVAATGQNDSAAGIGLSTDEMTGDDAPAQLDGFDFASTWTVTAAYPVLNRLNESEPGCVVVDESTVCDTDGDGRYRDVDGDGSVGQGDVAEFFSKQHRDAWKRPELFDFTGNGAVTHGDVVELADYVALQ